MALKCGSLQRDAGDLAVLSYNSSNLCLWIVDNRSSVLTERWSVCRFVKTAISFTQPIQRDKAPSTSYQYIWGTKVLARPMSCYVGIFMNLCLQIVWDGIADW